MTRPRALGAYLAAERDEHKRMRAEGYATPASVSRYADLVAEALADAAAYADQAAAALARLSGGLGVAAEDARRAGVAVDDAAHEVRAGVVAAADRLATVTTRTRTLARTLGDGGEACGEYLRATSAAHEDAEAWQAYALARVPAVVAAARTLAERAEDDAHKAAEAARAYLAGLSGETGAPSVVYAVAEVAAARYRVPRGLGDALDLAEYEAAQALRPLALVLVLDAVAPLAASAGDAGARAKAAQVAAGLVLGADGWPRNKAAEVEAAREALGTRGGEDA